MSRCRAAALALALSTVGCTGASGGPEPWLGSFGPPGTGVASGTFAGDAFNVQSVVSAVIPFPGGGSEGVIVASDVSGLCAKLQGGSATTNAHYIVMRAIEVDSDAPAPMKSPSAPESLRVTRLAPNPPNGKIAIVDYYRVGSSCGALSTPSARGKAGALAIDRIDVGGAYTGIAEFMTETGEDDRVTFTAESCAPQAVSDLLSGSLTCN